MEGKFGEIKRIPVKKYLHQGQEGLDAFRQEEFPRNPEEVKHALYDWGEFLIERYHDKTVELFRDDAPAILQKLKDTFLIQQEFANALELEDGLITLHPEKMQAVDEEVVANVLESEMIFPKVYIDTFRQSLVHVRNESDATTQAVYRKLRDLLHKSQARIVVRNGQTQAQSVEGFISAGVVTAATESWSILLAVVKKYNTEFHTPLTSEDLERLAPDMKRVLNQIASIHIADLGYLRDLAIEPGTPNLQQIAWEKILIFHEGESRLRLGIREEYQHVGDQDRERRECTVGCPARGAIVMNKEGKKTNVVGEVFEFHKELAKRVMLPYQKTLLSKKG